MRLKFREGELSRPEIILTLIILLFFWAPSLAQDNPLQRLEITADEMVADQKKNLIVFSGHVLARKENLLVKADRIEIVNREGKRKDISAIGRVEVTQGNFSARAEKAFYYEKEEKIILSGNARAREGENSIEGERIILLRKEDKVIVKGSENKRVKAIFYPRK